MTPPPAAGGQQIKSFAAQPGANFSPRPRNVAKHPVNKSVAAQAQNYQDCYRAEVKETQRKPGPNNIRKKIPPLLEPQISQHQNRQQNSQKNHRRPKCRAAPVEGNTTNHSRGQVSFAGESDQRESDEKDRHAARPGNSDANRPGEDDQHPPDQ